ncbi:hypothetical protein EDC01DRAFT_780012 [Geopyxis carbonaria]|nr:hypothetical protein EDC01DRAFT_780012 [Geopyxis carbonaria]
MRPSLAALAAVLLSTTAAAAADELEFNLLPNSYSECYSGLVPTVVPSAILTFNTPNATETASIKAVLLFNGFGFAETTFSGTGEMRVEVVPGRLYSLCFTTEVDRWIRVLVGGVGVRMS